MGIVGPASSAELEDRRAGEGTSSRVQLAHSCKEREASVPHHAAGAEGAIALAAWQPPERAVLEHAEHTRDAAARQRQLPSNLDRRTSLFGRTRLAGESAARRGAKRPQAF